MIDEPKTWLTRVAYKALEHEFEELTITGRRDIEQRIADARDHGDLRENAEYDAAKNEQGMMEARIRQVRHLLDTADVRDAASTGAVEIGTIATVVDGEGNEMEFFVAPAENKVAGLLLASPESPLGNALLGAKPGDSVSYEAPGGTFKYNVVAVRVYKG